MTKEHINNMPVLATKEKCTGCTACINVCPKKCLIMVKDEEGFEYPKLEDQNRCINCGLCTKSCPVIKEELTIKNDTIVYAAYSLDNFIRQESSSGGIFSEIAINILNGQGIVYGAAFDENFKVKHIEVNNIEDLYRLRGAKYAQSKLGDTFPKIKKQLDQGKKVLFVGTPCQVAGLKCYLKKDYSKLLCIDFICHGVPSPLAWEKYIKYRAELDNNGNIPCMISFRFKETGWSHYNYSVYFKYSEEKKYLSISSKDIYMKLFGGDYFCRESCSNCKFKGFNRKSDITLGDFWGVWDINPKMDDNRGTSVVFLHTQQGREMFEQISNKLKVCKVSLDEAISQNPSFIKSAANNSKRDITFENIREGKFYSMENWFPQIQIKDMSIKNKIKNKIKKMLLKK